VDIVTSPIDGTDDLVRRPVPGWLGKPLNRRLFLAGAAAGAATLGLTACSDDRSAPPTPTAAGSGGFPVTVVGKEGTATIPALPQRVVALGFERDAETALALGVTPIAMSESSLYPNLIAPWTEAKLTGSKPELLNTSEGFPFEKIVGLRPDVILATDSNTLADNYARLTQIAPTVSYIQSVESDTWQQRTDLIGKVLGRSEQAQTVITETEDKIKKAAQDNPTFAGKTVSFTVVAGREVYTVLEKDTSGTFLKQLSLTISPKVTALPESSYPGRALVSLENLGVLEADVVIVTYQSDDDRTFLEASQLFQQLNAVKNGAYIPLDLVVSVAMAYPSPLSIPYALEGMAPSVAKALA
jgi:iron complex transport system substrate-binding protein